MQASADETAAAAAAAAASVDEPPTTILDLPAEVELLIFSHLGAADLAACLASCTAWCEAAAAPVPWRALARWRWRNGWGEAAGDRGTGAVLQSLEQQGQWRSLYAERRKIDAWALSLLVELAWPDRHRAAAAAAQEGPAFPLLSDALQSVVTASEHLRRPVGAGASSSSSGSSSSGGSSDVTLAGWDASTDWPDAVAAALAAPCSSAYWARFLHRDLLVRHEARQLGRLAARVASAESELARRSSAAAAAAAGVGAGASAAVPAPAGPEGEEEEAQQGAAAAAGRQTDDQLRLEIALSFEEGALALAQVHQPFEDLRWVRRALDNLGGELRRRLVAAGIARGPSLAALQCLNQLLFGEGPPAGHPAAAHIPVPAPFGLGLSGNTSAYYAWANSMLDHVLSHRDGIPISLAVLHAAVGIRAGLPIQLLNIPMHVLTSMDEPASGGDGGGGQAQQPQAQPRRWYVDVFEKGRIMDGEGLRQFLQGLGLSAMHVREAQVMSPPQCWLRMCRNLLQIHKQEQEFSQLKSTALIMAAAAGEGTAEGTRAAVEAANACMALQQNGEAAALLRQVMGGPQGPYQLALGDQAAVHGATLQALLREFEQGEEEHVRGAMRVRRRQGPEAARVQFRVGQVLQHARYAYRGVIVGWHTECQASEEWMQQMGVDRLAGKAETSAGCAGGRHQPFYVVLPDTADLPGHAQMYVAQQNIELAPLPPLHRAKPGHALHPECGRYFSRLAADGATYEPLPWLRQAFPDDWEA